MIFRKKPIVVSAVQYNGCNLNKIIDFVGEENVYWFSETERLFVGNDGIKDVAFPGDYIVRESKNKIYVVRKMEFNRTYEKVIEEKPLTITVSKDINQILVEDKFYKKIISVQTKFIKLEFLLYMLLRLLDGVQIKYKVIVEE